MDLNNHKEIVECFSIEAFAASPNLLAVSVAKTPCGYHTGIIYKDIDESVFVLHLAWHEILRKEEIHEAGFCVWVPPNFMHEHNAEAAAEFLNSIYKRYERDGLPYGLFFDGTAKFNNIGELTYGNGMGLTCATFVLAVLDNIGYMLCDIDDWESRLDEDEQWLRCILSQITVNSVLKNQLNNELGCLRYKPCEVAGSSFKHHTPVKFELAKQLAESIEMQLS